MRSFFLDIESLVLHMCLPPLRSVTVRSYVEVTPYVAT
jgi:hypothetical protein